MADIRDLARELRRRERFHRDLLFRGFQYLCANLSVTLLESDPVDTSRLLSSWRVARSRYDNLPSRAYVPGRFGSTRHLSVPLARATSSREARLRIRRYPPRFVLGNSTWYIPRIHKGEYIKRIPLTVASAMHRGFARLDRSFATGKLIDYSFFSS